MVDEPHPTPPAPQDPSSGVMASKAGTQQSQVAAVIVLTLLIVSLSAIWGSVWVALAAISLIPKNPTAAAVVFGFAGALVVVASTAVGGLINALVAPSGIAGVIASAKRDGQ